MLIGQSPPPSGSESSQSMSESPSSSALFAQLFSDFWRLRQMQLWPPSVEQFAFPHEESAQSVAPLQSLSIPSLHARPPSRRSSPAGVGTPLHMHAPAEHVE